MRAVALTSLPNFGQLPSMAKEQVHAAVDKIIAMCEKSAKATKSGNTLSFKMEDAGRAKSDFAAKEKIAATMLAHLAKFNL